MSETDISQLTVAETDNDAFSSMKNVGSKTQSLDIYDNLLLASYCGGQTVTEQGRQKAGDGSRHDRLSYTITYYESQLVDVLNTYPWTIDTFSSVDKINNQIGWEYQTEYQTDSYQREQMSNEDKKAVLENQRNMTYGLVDIGDDYGFSSQRQYRYNAVSSEADVNSFKSVNVPFCYVTEWRQSVSSNIMNIINSISAGATAIGQFTSDFAQLDLTSVSSTISKLKTALFSKTQQGYDSTQNVENDEQQDGKNIKNFIQGVQEGIGILGEQVDGFADTLLQAKDFSNPALNTKWLKPYSFLYALKQTGKKYCFPMITNPPVNNVLNVFGEVQDGSGVLNNSILNGIVTMGSGIAGVVRDLRDVVSFFGGNMGQGGYIGSAVEKAKYFNFPNNTQEYRVTFPLLNTVKANDWKKNYRFILLFTLRNMIYRKDNSSYYPPLFYDLIIPGVIRQPFCYVSKVQIRPVGNVRTLGYDQGLLRSLWTGDSNHSVNVPEAWIVTINFTSLLTTSANMVLSGLYDLNISTE